MGTQSFLGTHPLPGVVMNASCCSSSKPIPYHRPGIALLAPLHTPPILTSRCRRIEARLEGPDSGKGVLVGDPMSSRFDNDRTKLPACFRLVAAVHPGASERRPLVSPSPLSQEGFRTAPGPVSNAQSRLSPAHRVSLRSQLLTARVGGQVT